MLLIENADVLAPEPLERQSILIANDRIAAIGGEWRVDAERIDASGCIAMPGLVDPHAHLVGGSGEKGFASATPALTADDLLRAGITTVVGTLGTDTTTKTMPALLARVKALREAGLSAYAWSGGYDARPLTRSIRDDIVLIDEIVGAGEIAIADVRASQFSAAELARLAADCYVAGTLTGKAGLLHLHVGPSDDRLRVLREVIERFDVRPETLYPTHVERSEKLMDEAMALGCPIDVDVVDEDLAKWLRYYRERGGDPNRITASSDAPIGKPANLFAQMIKADALPLCTRNPARILKLRDVGELAAGRKAHVLLVDAKSHELRTVVCAGRVVTGLT
jgi:beta-aspartyl-dipeptidase (metallo-type)